MTINQYIQKFMKLARYAPEDVDNDRKKHECFLNRLHSEMRTQLIAHDYIDFNTLVNKAILTENARTSLLNDPKRKIQARKLKQQESTNRSCSTVRVTPVSSRHSSAPSQQTNPSINQGTRPNNGCYGCRHPGYYLAQCPY